MPTSDKTDAAAIPALPLLIGETTDDLLIKQDTNVPLSKSPNPQVHVGSPASAAEADVAALGTAYTNLSRAEQCPDNDAYEARRAQCRHDCANLTPTQLRALYSSEASCHKNMLGRRKEHGRVVDPAIRKFKDFLYEVGPKPTRTCTLDRIDNNDPEYAPGKIRWADKTRQTANRSNTHLFELADGRQYTTAQLSKLLKVPEDTIRKRRDRGWTDDEVFAGKRLPGGQTKPTPPEPAPSRGSRRQASLDVIWLQTLDDCYPRKWWNLMPAERKMLKTIERELTENGLSERVEEVVSYALQHWEDVLEVADKMFSAYPLPTYPTVHFVHKHIIAVVNLWISTHKMQFIDRRLTVPQTIAAADVSNASHQNRQLPHPQPHSPPQPQPEARVTLKELFAPVNLKKALA